MKSYKVVPMFNIFVSHLPCWGQSLLIQNYKIFLMLVHDLPRGPARYAVLEFPVYKKMFEMFSICLPELVSTDRAGVAQDYCYKNFQKKMKTED